MAPKGGQMLTDVPGNVCPVCGEEHQWRAKNWIGLPVIVCPKVPRDAIYVVPSVEAPPPLLCSRCGTTEEDAEYGLLSEVRVIIAEGEEGHADVTMLLCGRDLEVVIDALVALGFKDHRHGGINYLEDRDCPGWGKCPTPNPEDANGDTAPWNGTYVVPGPTP